MLGLGLSLGLPMLRQRALESAITAAFSSSEPGAWYDPSDLSTLFQDAAGTTPVTAVEQPVGRILINQGAVITRRKRRLRKACAVAAGESASVLHHQAPFTHYRRCSGGNH